MKQAYKTSTYLSIISLCFCSVFPLPAKCQERGAHVLFKDPPLHSFLFEFLSSIVNSFQHLAVRTIRCSLLPSQGAPAHSNLWALHPNLYFHLTFSYMFINIYMYSTCPKLNQFPICSSRFCFKKLFLTLYNDLMINLFAQVRILGQG